MQDPQKDFRKKLLGRQGEALTCKYLKKHGYKVIMRNYVTPFGEADIVAKSRDGYICFVEVKTRTRDDYGLPSEAVDREKRRRYRQIAGYYCAVENREVPVRFDIASIVDGNLEYFENAYI